MAENTSNDHQVSLLSNHGHVLLCIAEEPDIRVREIAARTGITERAAHRIISELESSGYVSHIRVGRRNRYELADRSGRHELERHLRITDLMPYQASATTGDHA